jgi:hypothetical protein
MLLVEMGRLHPYLRKFGYEVFGIDSSSPVRIKEIQSRLIFLVRQGKFFEIANSKIEKVGR